MADIVEFEPQISDQKGQQNPSLAASFILALLSSSTDSKAIGLSYSH